MDQPRPVRIAVVGDELVCGSGDTRALGWLGRVMARTPRMDPRVDAYTLAVPGEGTTDMSERWERETSTRFSHRTDNRLVIGLGHQDVLENLSTARSRLNLANVLDQASAQGIRCFVVGPPPSLDGELNRKLLEFSRVLGDVAARRNVPYVDMFTPLVTHEQWRTDLAAGGGLPGQAGYGLMAWLVLHRGWYQWLGLPDPALG